MDKRATQLLVLGGAAALAIYLVTRSARAATEAIVTGDRDETGSRRGGLLPRVGELIGGEDQFSETVESVQLPRGGGAVKPSAPTFSSNPLDYLAGEIVDPPEGGRVDRALFSSTVRWTAELVNSSSTPWTGVLRFEVDEDYLIKDNKGSYTRTVTVPANGQPLQLKIDYSLVGGAHLKEPDLTVRMFAGTKLLSTRFMEVV